jgi:hypothetical protein
VTRAHGVDGDAVRTAALVAATAALVSVPTLGPALLGTREEVARYDTAVTPPDYAFAVWAPIFAGCVATAVQAALPGRSTTPESRAAGWPLAGAFGLCTAWSVASQSGRLAATPVLLPASVALTAVAHRRLQDAPGTTETLASVTTGLLLGWTALAAVVNLSVGTQLLGADPTSRRSVVGSTLAVVAAAGGLAGVVATSRRGHLPLALTATWGLATTASDPRRPVTARIGTGLGAGGVVLAALARQSRTWRR